MRDPPCLDIPGVRKKRVPLANFLAPLRGAVAGFSHGFSPRSKNVKTFMLECRSLNLVEESRWVFINQSVRVADTATEKRLPDAPILGGHMPALDGLRG